MAITLIAVAAGLVAVLIGLRAMSANWPNADLLAKALYTCLIDHPEDE